MRSVNGVRRAGERAFCPLNKITRRDERRGHGHGHGTFIKTSTSLQRSPALLLKGGCGCSSCSGSDMMGYSRADVEIENMFLGAADCDVRRDEA